MLLGLTPAASATYSAIRKKIFRSGVASSIISNEEVNDIMKIFKFLEESGLLINCVGEALKNEVRNQKAGFLGIILDTLGANLLGSLLIGKAQARVFNAILSFNKFQKTKALSKQT